MKTDQPFQYLSTTVPANSGILIAFDTTRSDFKYVPVAVVGADALLIPPNPAARSRFLGWGIQGIVKCTGQNVTARLMGRTLQDVLAADWEEEKNAVATAGTALGIDWQAFSNHFMLRIDCGATAPTKLVVDIRIVAPVGR